jgi:hypothetical protein
MNFLRNKKLTQLGGSLLALTVIAFIAQYFLLKSKIQQLEEAQLKQEFTRIAQVSNQQIALSVQDYLDGNQAIASDIAAQLDYQENRLGVLSTGGRIEQTQDFIEPLSRLPRITLRSLMEDWQDYKKSIITILTSAKATEHPEPIIAPTDSSGIPIATIVSMPAGANRVSTLQYKGLSITMKGWYDKLMVDLDEEVRMQKGSLERWSRSIVVLNILVTTVLFGLFFQFVVRPLRQLKQNLATHQHTLDLPQNEIGEVAANANNTLENLRDATEFVMAIGKGNLNINFAESFDRNYVKGKNALADSLIDMQNKLRELNEEEQKRQWANEGLAKFVDIMRSSNDNLHELGDKIVSALVQYTKSNQGALYILNEDNQGAKVLDLVSLFAFDIKKFETQKIKPGQGILGQTFLEKETTYLTDLPEEYIRITSGLGGANPKCILIVPLKVDTEVYGLVELASFNEMASHEIAFVEKLGESIASTLASVRSTHRQKLLIEQFQQQTEQMRAQEEEMRQNMEELQATQEEVTRKENSYIARISELERQLKDQPGEEALQQLGRSFSEKEKIYQQRLEDLQKQLQQKSVRSDDWAVIEELEKNFRFHLEALRMAEEEVNQKRKA